MQFWGLYQSLQLITEPRGDAMHEKQLLKNANVLSRCLIIDSNLAADLSEVRELPRLMSKRLEYCNHRER